MRSFSSQWQCVYVCAYPFRMQHALIGPLFSAILVVQNFLAVWASDQNYTIWWLRIRCNKHVVKNGWVKKPLGGKIINRSFSVSALQTEVSITFFTFDQHQVKVLRLHHILSDGYTSPSHAQLKSCYLQKQTSHLHTESVCSRRAKSHTACTIDVNSLHIRVSTLLIRWLMTANSLRSHHAFYHRR